MSFHVFIQDRDQSNVFVWYLIDEL